MNRVEQADDLVPLRHAIVSVADKEGIDEFAKGLLDTIPELTLYSTGGTYRKLVETLGEEESRLVELSSYTGQPEMQGGLVKSLDFHVHAGLLAEPGNDAHRRFLEKIGAVYFDMVVVNLYPFQRTVATEESDLEDARGNIDIGGPTMLRAAAKNFLRVAAVSNPGHYQVLLRELSENAGALSLNRRLLLARETFEHTMRYEAAIAEYFQRVEPHELDSTYRLTRR